MTLYHDLRTFSRRDHADVRLQPYPGYGFAREVTELPVHAFELQHLVPVLPLAFRIEGDKRQLVGITGVRPQENVFVGPKDGLNAITTPDVLETYPFAMERSGEGKGVLCLDMASDLLSRFEGSPLLDDQGQPTETLQGYQTKLKAQFKDRRTTAKAIQLLADSDVLAPWTVDDVETLDGNIHHYVKLAALHALDRETQAELAQYGALALAYAQAYAMANMKKVRRMAQRRQSAKGDVSSYLKSDDELDFGDDAVLDFS